MASRSPVDSSLQTDRRVRYWEAERKLEGLVDHVEVRLDPRLRPYLRVAVGDPLQRFILDGVTEDLDRIRVERSA